MINSGTKPLRDEPASTKAKNKSAPSDSNTRIQRPKGRATSRPGSSNSRRDPTGGTLIARLGSSKVPSPVRLRRVTGDKRLHSNLRKVEGRYVLGQELGRGGMGVVRLVKDLDIGRQVAMKTLIPDDPDTDSLVDSLIAEAQTTGQLQHPNIVPLYELGVLSNNEVFYTMKAVSGSTLKDILSKVRKNDEATLTDFTLRRLLTIFGQVCLAMHYAHTRGVVHRDLKPDNLLIGEFGEVLVLDWGIAYVLHKRTRGVLAQPGMVLGTPHYMSPEQARGEIKKIDGRSDIFSLGVILYELLTLELPLMGDDTEQVLEKLRCQEEPKRPTTVDPERPVPTVLADVCVKAMSPDSDDRFQDARQLYDKIEEFLEGSAERERRTKMAYAELAVGVQAMDRYYELKNSREQMGIRLAQRERSTHRWDTQAVKRDLWDMRARHGQMDLVVSQAFSEAVNHFHRVLGLLPEQAQSRAALAKMFLTRLKDAEEVYNYADMIYFGDLVLRFNDPDHGGPLKKGNGTLTARSFPEGADLVLFDFTKGVPDTRLESGLSLGAAPITDYSLPTGLYLIVARKDGYRDDHVPIFVRPEISNVVTMGLQPWASEEKMIGRAGELDVLRFNFERTVENREMRRIRLSGTAGSGKNRLLNVFFDFLEDLIDPVWFFFAECHEQHALIPYGAISECLRIRMGIKTNESTDSVRTKLEQMMIGAMREMDKPPEDIEERITHTADILASLPGLAVSEQDYGSVPTDTRNRFDRALIDLLDIVTQAAPTVFVFQEIEYLDDATARVITLANRFVKNMPVMILGIGSGGALEKGWDEHIKLGPLSTTGVEALIRHILKGSIPANLIQYVMSATAGTPWHIVDIVRRTVEEKQLLFVDGRWHLNEAALLPEAVSVYEARSRRIRELPKELSEALRAAAVIGDVFWEEALVDLGVEDPKRCCAQLVEQEFIRALPTSRYPQTQAYTFRSLLFREIVYDSIRNHAKLPEWHQMVAAWIRERQQGDLREIAELAWHSELARDEAWASMLFVNLGDICRDVGCNGMARECYIRAMANTFDDTDRTELQKRIGDVDSRSGEAHELD